MLEEGLELLLKAQDLSWQAQEEEAKEEKKRGCCSACVIC